MDILMMEKYARLLVMTGTNIQKGQTLAIVSSVESKDFTRMVSAAAYKAGAAAVYINWFDDSITRELFINSPQEILKKFPSWQADFYLTNLHNGAAFLIIDAQDPQAFEGTDPDRLSMYLKAKSAAIMEYRESAMNNRHVWCIASIPSVSWAKKVFPDLQGDEAVEKLWNAILKTVRVDTDDPVDAWRKHINSIAKYVQYLNSVQFKTLHYTNSFGTDLNIELPENHIWYGGSDHTTDGLEFVANMPTEEVYTLPKKTGVNGRVVSSMPLSYNGNLIDKFSLTFKNGKIVDFGAERGYDTLKSLVETDEGSHYLGEVALVPYDSPISNMNILFYSTLFDENASCHLAIGKAYPICIKNGENMDNAELEGLGVNDSDVHVDFMIGTKDLEITGVTHDGRQIPVFKNGNFAI